MKRSRTVALSILGAAAFGLAGCQEEATEAASFADLDSCLAAATDGGWFTKSDCVATFSEAQKLHEETAPRYESREVCEAEHGAGACGEDSVAGSGGGGFSFMPLLVGYMIGQALGGGRPMAQPVVPKAGGGFTTPAGTGISRIGGAGPVSAAAFDKAPVTKGLPPMTKAQVQSKGGFGGTAGTRSVSG